MALPDSTDPPERKQTEIHKGSERKEKFHTKVIIRRLPPSMDQETFCNQISPVPNYDYMYMVKGDASLGENAFARAYINFTNPNDIYDFKEKFDNYVFLNNAGHEYPAVVEYASFQKVPKKRNKVRVDPKNGTIETDPYYLEFVEMINKPPEQDEKPEYSYQLTAENKNDTTTPLLEFVKNKRAERLRIREERREERKRKEFERKKFRDEERKRRFDEKSPAKGKTSLKEKIVEVTESEKPDNEVLPEKSKVSDKLEKEETEKPEKSSSSYYKNREKKYEDRRKDVKSKYPPKKEYADKREYKGRRDDFKDRDYRSKFEDNKKEVEAKVQKKVKKYSEKREERKMEAQKKLEQQAKEQQTVAKTESDVVTESAKAASLSPENKSKASSSPDNKPKGALNSENSSKASSSSENKSKTSLSPEHNSKERLTKKDEAKAAMVDEIRSGKDCESKPAEKKERNRDGESQRRIRNKDRPTIAIYRPGMLSKRRQSDGEPENKKE